MVEGRVNEQLVKQCLHRYRSLEVEIVDAARSGLLTEGRYNDRMKRLERVKKALDSVRERQETAYRPKLNEMTTLELPVLSDCSRVEQNIIRATLAENNRMLEQISLDAKKLLSYTRDANNDNFNWISAIMKLSWMRARFLWTTKQLELVRSARRLLEDFIAKFSPSKERIPGQGDLVEAFREFEAATSRIAKLRTKLQSETAINRDQEGWLRSYENRRKETTAPNPPPGPAEFIRVKMEVEERIFSGSNIAAERLVIATNLASTLTKESREKSKEKSDGNAFLSKALASEVPLKRKKSSLRRGVRP